MKHVGVILAALLAVVATEGETVFRSGPARVHLVELYTSEGCSSCPAADSWMNGLGDDSRLWTDFVPVAFHVDYWDYALAPEQVVGGPLRDDE